MRRLRSDQVWRNGSSQGHAKYQCTACGHQARFAPAAIARAVRYAQVEKLLVERNSQRSIVRVTGVSRMTVAKLAKKKVQALFWPLGQVQAHRLVDAPCAHVVDNHAVFAQTGVVVAGSPATTTPVTVFGWLRPATRKCTSAS